ncbi:DUF397 domain-containing protein [Kineosporia sp. J2-2]|uniref:DUF397 domain-containing protein n=1 Tax=Kineosporia corallincola TaxID=2835133 RepID=A0ABS5TTQ2_9ACTN|nr:DUF397 domain-containing protein [Kineosporia corallincola]MBT0774196.1 DUF397 domain-containing protein [Kineosporia corallincola]
MAVFGQWVTSTASAPDNLLSVRVLHEMDATLVRDSGDPLRPALALACETWDVFVASVKAGSLAPFTVPVAIQRHRDGVTLIWNIHDPEGPVLAISAPEWAAFLTGVSRGEFDRDVAAASAGGREPSVA